ncbi:YybH family protein [Mucilaginibacter segetis]|uniref:Nuclear transport factor 2 family protein n=1 Tax=Mucilaginibacter segetis TaxID=2793071 RepID=A0A934PT89_9SPHI|nr:nuclear transport factor 2 family protein [Mucilaginibacter segetis]MBK0380403.1 nuclear transport factor 2 family protein [Mucilaginibacter segetis]
MKKITLSCLLLVFTCCCFGQDRQAIIKLMNQQQIAWNNGDIPGFMQGYWKSDSLMFIGKNGPTYGWQQTLDNYKRGYPDKAAMGQLTFRIDKVELLGKRDAFVMGAWHLKREGDEPGGYFTLWFRKIDGEWKIVCDHTS